MKKFILSASLATSFALYVFFHSTNASTDSRAGSIATSEPVAPVSSAFTPAASPGVTQPPHLAPQAAFSVLQSYRAETGAAQPKPQPKSALKPVRTGLYADGTYVGTIADAYYGNVQVQATIQDGRIADVQFLQYPNDRRTSQFINSQAMPYLRIEAIRAQSANVDTISGATDTSMGFRESLLSALAQAKS